MKWKQLKHLFIAGTAILSVLLTQPPLYSQETNSTNTQVLPEIGFVASSNGIVVRERYPKIDVKGGYQKAAKKCSIGQGVAFQITGAKTVVNQELWYQIETLGNIASKSVNCGTSTSGWVIGQLSDGKNLVETLTISQAQLQQVTPTDPPAQVQQKLTVQPADGGGEKMEPPPLKAPVPNDKIEDQGAGTLLVWWNYVAIALGSVIGFIFLDLERDRMSTIQDWMVTRNFIRVVFLVVFNILLLNVACSDFSLLSIGILQSLPSLIQSFWGTFIAGIALSVVILKAIAFSWSGGD